MPPITLIIIIKYAAPYKIPLIPIPGLFAFVKFIQIASLIENLTTV